jgi:hypothetical protein
MSLNRWLAAVLICVALALVPVAGAPQVARAATSCFVETGHCIYEPFLAYWQTRGGLAIHGYPLTGARPERLEDGNTYIVQYFERSRFELHPENAPPHDVLLGQFGRVLYLTDPTLPLAGAAAPLPGATYFGETGHNLRGRFLQYWQENGDLAQFGFPISEELREVLEDGREYTVQYFERARLELHPENAAPYDVLLGQFGRRILAANGPVGALPYPLSERVADKYGRDPGVRARLGMPTSVVTTLQGAIQPFEHGAMLWRADTRTIYVLIRQDRGGSIPVGAWQSFADTWREGDEPGGGTAPAPGLYLPQRGFGKIWREHPELQQLLGYATSAEERAQSFSYQPFTGGLAIDTPGTQPFEANYFFLYLNGRYESYTYPF